MSPSKQESNAWRQLFRLCFVLGIFLGLPESISFVSNAKKRSISSSFIKHAKQHKFRSIPGELRSQDGEVNDDNEDEDDEEIVSINLNDQDWRTFRAKLVMGEAGSTKVAEGVSPQSIEENEDLDGIGALFSSQSSFSMDQSSAEHKSRSLVQGLTPLDPSQWAYDSGTVIEQGAVILGGVEQDYGFALRQQYFHKSAILVLSHDDRFTKGIILNRPTDLTLRDDVNVGVKWRVWFGGDVQGFNSENPEIVCIHSLKNDQAIRVSTTVMKDIRWTSFESAKRLVKVGVAKPNDFWVFSGYAGWGSGQLMGELERKSWYMVATDSQTLLKELARQGAGADPREAGLETWTLLMNMIGRGATVRDRTSDFDDLMLKEWAHKNLLSKAAGGGAFEIVDHRPKQAAILQQIRTIDASLARKLKPGVILRAAPHKRSPFLLDDQELHKSIILVISNDANMCLGVMLSRPAAKGLDIYLTDKSNVSRTIQVPIRYGGKYALKGNDPIIWLHCNSALKASRVGQPIGSTDGIWKCTSTDVISAIGRGTATPKNFMAVSGVYVWAREQGEIPDGEKSEKFEIIPEWKVSSVFEELAKQEVLSPTNLDSNLLIAHRAWKQGAEKVLEEMIEDNCAIPISGLGDGFDEEDENLVFKSDVKVSKLCDDALRSWVATFLLGSLWK